MKKSSNDRRTAGKKLTLDRQTLRTLTSSDLTHVAGGMPSSDETSIHCPE